MNKNIPNEPIATTTEERVIQKMLRQIPLDKAVEMGLLLKAGKMLTATKEQIEFTDAWLQWRVVYKATEEMNKTNWL